MALVDGTLFELARFRKAPNSVAVRLLTRGLSCIWWQERTILDKETITPRWQPPISAESHRQRAAHALSHKK